MTHHDVADMSKHSEEQLHEGIEKADEQEPRVADKDSNAALAAQREQREAMAEELAERQAEERS